MELVIVALISASVAVAGAIGGLILGSQAGRRAANDQTAQLRTGVEQLTLSHGSTVDSVREYMERAASQAQRTASERSNIERRSRREQDAAPAMTEADYLAHLNKGGGALPEVERALGLMS